MKGGMYFADGVSLVVHGVREQLFLGASQIKIMADGGVRSMYDSIQTVQFTFEEMRAAVGSHHNEIPPCGIFLLLKTLAFYAIMGLSWEQFPRKTVCFLWMGAMYIDILNLLHQHNMPRPTSRRPGKGICLLDMPRDYVLVSLQATGPEPAYDDLLEITLLRIRGSLVVDEFHSLLAPEQALTPFTSRCTSLTNDMLVEAPSPLAVMPQVLAFIEQDTLVGFRMTSHINYLYDWSQQTLGCAFANDYVDLLSLAYLLIPELSDYRLPALAQALGLIPEPVFRSTDACHAIRRCYNQLITMVEVRFGDTDELLTLIAQESTALRRHCLVVPEYPQKALVLNSRHLLHGRHVLVADKPDALRLGQLHQCIKQRGGICETSLSPQVNYLVLANHTYENRRMGKITPKQRQAEQLCLAGQDLTILSESAFYELLL